MPILVKNKKAYFNYKILKEFQAGIELYGWEVKSIKNNRASLDESFIDIKKSEAFIYGMHVNNWYKNTMNTNINETRKRKLLLHKKEIEKIADEKQRKALTIVPLNIHTKRGYIKLQIALAKGLKKFDKRSVLKQKEQKKEIEKDLKNAGY